jgi:heat shock protein HspQ
MLRRGAALASGAARVYVRPMTEMSPSATQSGFVAAKFQIGQVVRHRVHPFRGVIFDVDPEFANTEEWWDSIPEELRPRKDQPFYHLFAENETSYYVAYVSEQNLVPDESGDPVDHPQIDEMFGEMADGRYELHQELRH